MSSENIYTNLTFDSPRFQQLNKELDRRIVKRDDIKERLKEAKRLKVYHRKRVASAKKLLEIVRKVIKETQEILKAHISNLVTMALSAVFPDPYEFELDFVQRRGQTECDIFFVKNGERMSPVDASGGGALDVASFALVCVFWTINKKRPVLLFDECFKFLHSPELQENCGLMVKEVAERLKLQIIIVSDQRYILENADKVFEVSQTNGISEVKEVD